MYSVKNSTLRRFVEAMRILPDETESEQTLKDLVRTLGRAVEKGETSALPMLDTKLNFVSDLTGLHCVIDAGGTQLRFYHVWRPDASLLEIRPFMRKMMPGTGKTELTRAAFLTQLVNVLVPLIQEMERFEIQQSTQKPVINSTHSPHIPHTNKTIDGEERLLDEENRLLDGENRSFTAAPASYDDGAHLLRATPPLSQKSAKPPIRVQFSFSYPVEVDEVAEVRPIAFTKNFKARQLLGMPLRQSLEDALKKELKKVNIDRTLQITILNDTVAVYAVGVLAGIQGWTTEAHSATTSKITSRENTPTEDISREKITSREDISVRITSTESTSVKSSFENNDVIRIDLQKSMKAIPPQLKASQRPDQSIDNQASPQAVIGVVYGTGFNICYEDVKIESDVLKWKIFNTEIGCYAGLPSGCIDKEVDRSSDNPGNGLAEKHISGAYIGKLYKAALIKLGEMDFATGELGSAGELTTELTEEVRTFLKNLGNTDHFISNEALNQFLDTGKLSLFDEESLSVEVTELFRELLTIITCRSAYYAALLTAGVVFRIIHRQEINSIIISLEGGLVENFPNLFQLYKKYLNKWVCSLKTELRIIRVNQAVPLGSIFVKWESTRI
ncbi:hypothetical protein COTS27_01544 [Spirochaetota bacterium]|nr:hypothetical protein COTS27_01544 [Spirochaetota bacterium]